MASGGSGTGASGRGERRAAPRRTIEVDGRLEHADGEAHGVVVNISFGGAKFVTRVVSPELALGSRVALTVRSDDDGGREITWLGNVVRSERSGDDGPPRVAYAISFDEAEPPPLDDLDDLDVLDDEDDLDTDD